MLFRNLQSAARGVYDGERVVATKEMLDNSAIRNLMRIKNLKRGAEICAFYHRSIAAFVLAEAVVWEMLKNPLEPEGIVDAFSHKLKDDVTNFIGSKFAVMPEQKKKLVARNLETLYKQITPEENNLTVREQIIYYITRLGVDVTRFLKTAIAPEPTDRIMRLTLAYGCVLSQDPELREFALQYAKCLATNGEDAKTNRGWTVVYFGDVEGKDPYEYMDEEKGSWTNARAARIKRFTKKNPRPKDYLFQMFDVPLFRTFLEVRSWTDISIEEYRILERLSFPEEYFFPNEIEFLNHQKELLLDEYKMHLESEPILKSNP